MTSLQRSSVSFRRQGSSGRIWEDHFQLRDPKAAHTVSPSGRSQVEDRKFRATMAVESPPHDSSMSSKAEHKAQRCFLSSFFGRCLGSTTAQVQVLLLVFFMANMPLLLSPFSCFFD